MELKQVFDEYCEDKKLEGFSVNTLKAYTVQWKLFSDSFDELTQFEDITTSQLKQYINKSSQHLKPGSVAHRVKSIRSVFRWAHEEGITTHNASARLKFPKEGVRIPKFISEESLELIRMSQKSDVDQAIIEFMYSAGVRIGEVYGMNRSDINLNNRSVVVRGKGNKEREVYFSKRAEIWIKRYFERRTDECEAFIVTKNKPYKRMSIAQMRSRLKKVSKKSGVTENIYPHKMRHTYATHLVNKGAPLSMIQDMLGHSNMDTTRIYAYASGEKRKQAYDQYF